MDQKLYQLIASTVSARKACSGDPIRQEWYAKHSATLESLTKNLMPSGAGWDTGTMLSLEKSTNEKLVFYGEYHHMNDNGFYDGWTAHTITVRASLVWELSISVSGRNRNDIKDYLHDLFHAALTQTVQYLGDRPIYACRIFASI